MNGMMEYLFKNKLDKIDIKMLDALRNDARISLKDLSSKCRVSKQTALYRLKKLVEENIIKGFHAKIDYARLGYSTYYVYIQTRYIENEKEFIAELSRLTGCIVIMKSVTQYNFNIKIITKDICSMTSELEGFFNKKKNVISHFILQRLERAKETYVIDDIDKAILQELCLDCRKNSLEISRKTGFGYDAVHNHMKRLIKDKILTNFITVMNFENLMYYSILLKFADDQLDRLAVFESLLKMDSLVVERYKCLGEFSYVFEIVDRDYKSINEKLNRIRSQFYGLIRNSQLVPIEDHYFYDVKLE
jgi:Lrp/AsnC family transcriptional regulator